MGHTGSSPVPRPSLGERRMHTHRRLVLGGCMTILAVHPQAVVAQTATQVVTFSVVSSSRVAIGNLVTSAPVEAAAADPRRRTSAMVAGATYAVATNEANQKIAASLDAPVPSTLSLAVVLDPPRGAASKGLRSLSTTATDVVTGITGSEGAALPMRYRWNNAASAAVLRNRIVTYTITAGL